jgi:hypothetical protein
MLRRSVWLLALIGVGGWFNSSSLLAQENTPVPGTCWTAEQLTRLSWCELEAIYRQAQAGPLPNGFGRGHVIYGPDKHMAEFSGHLASVWWRGKHFNAACGTVMNQWLACKAVPARLFYGPSKFDGQPSVILDYTDSWHNWQNVRDEARALSPCLYLGAMFIGCADRPKVYFVLEFDGR